MFNKLRCFHISDQFFCLSEESAQQDWVSAEVKEMLETADLDMDTGDHDGDNDGNLIER